MTSQLALDFTAALERATEAGNRGRLRAQIRAENLQPEFTRRAAEAILAALRDGPQSGEALVSRCKAMGIVPLDDRAFGAAFKMLAREGRIRQAGWTQRARGHGSGGGRIWALAQS